MLDRFQKQTVTGQLLRTGDYDSSALQTHGSARYDHGIMTMIERNPMKTMPAGQFKVHCLKVMDEVASKREPVVITKRGKPVAKLVPLSKEKDDIFGFLKGKGKVLGDIVSPILTPEEWGDLY
jgi:prevent-host-death family protein